MSHTNEQRDEFEGVVFAAQHAWIRREFGKEAADGANHGWGVSVDEERISVATKVYGQGVLTTNAKYCDPATLEHSFEPV